MGNVPAGNNISSLTQCEIQGFNKALGEHIQIQYSVCANEPTGKRPAVLFTYLTSEKTIGVVYPKAAELFDIVSGEKSVYCYTAEEHTFISVAALMMENLLFALNTGVYQVLDRETLLVRKEIIPEGLLPGLVTYMCSLTESTFICGHTSGEITIWSIPERRLSQQFESGYPPTSVSCIDYSVKRNSIVVGFSNEYQGLDGNQQFQERTSLKVYNLSSCKVNGIAVIRGKCLGLIVMNNNNIVATMGMERSVGVWDLVNGFKLLDTKVPTQICESVPQTMTKLITTEGKCFVAFGFYGCSVGISELVFDGNEMAYAFRWRATAVRSSNSAVTCLSYDSSLDTLSLGNARAEAFILNNISSIPATTHVQTPLFSLESHEVVSKPSTKNEHLPVLSIGGLSIESFREKKEELPDAPVPPKRLTPFEVFFNAKKPEFLQETPGASHKELVLKATGLWAVLTEQERDSFNS